MEARPPTVLSRRRFDIDDYHAMIRAGILGEDDRVELLDGEIVQMHAIGSRHLACVSRLTRLLVPALLGRALVSVQGPVQLDRYSLPEPDIAVLRARDDDYAAAVPTASDVLLLVEVADSSLRTDRLVKLPLYAAAGIAEVWLVDLTTDTIERYRGPAEGGFRSHDGLGAGAIAPEAFPELALEVDAIVPVRAGA